MTPEAQLAAYAAEIDVPDFTLEQLILSHRRMRATNQEYSIESSNQWAAAKQRGYEAAKLQLTADFISVEKLRAMTVQELSDFLGNT